MRRSWLSSFNWEGCCILATHCLGPAYLLRHRDRRDAPNFHSVLRAWSWLLGYRHRILEDNSSIVCPVSFDLWVSLPATESLVLRESRRLANRVDEWHGSVEIYLDAILWAKQRLPLQYKSWKKYKDILWADFLELERCLRLRLEIFPEWHQPVVDIIFDDTMSNCLVPNSD